MKLKHLVLHRRFNPFEITTMDFATRIGDMLHPGRGASEQSPVAFRLDRRKALSGTFAILLATTAIPASAGIDPPPEVRRYDVLYTSTPPVIDGQRAPGEWAAAADGGGNWHLLRQGRTDPPSPPVDAHGNEFRMLWDSTALYLLIENGYGGWLQRPTPNAQGRYPVDLGGSTDAFSVYFDPNTDGEPNFSPGSGQQQPDTNVDGYEIAFNVYNGTFSCGGTVPCTPVSGGTPILNQGPTFGTFGEAHVDTLFGNQAQWTGMKATEIAQQNDASGGTVELKIPWTDFDADASGAAGLNHPFAPQVGDAWFFQLGSTRTDAANFLPVWNWTTSNYFAAHPHGEIVFRQLQADFDKDGQVDGDDFLLWQANYLRLDATANEGDADGDADVDGDDFLLWQVEFGDASARSSQPSSSVPEPATWALAAAGLALLTHIRPQRRADHSEIRPITPHAPLQDHAPVGRTGREIRLMATCAEPFTR